MYLYRFCSRLNRKTNNFSNYEIFAIYLDKITAVIKKNIKEQRG